MSIIDLKKQGDVFILSMQSGENRFNRTFIDALNEALDTVENSSGPAALVTIGGEDKFYSNGLDLAWLSGDGQGEAPEFIKTVLKLLGRIMAFPVPTAAAINGHAFAAGAMLALAHDFRVMRSDRGFLLLARSGYQHSIRSWHDGPDQEPVDTQCFSLLTSHRGPERGHRRERAGHCR